MQHRPRRRFSQNFLTDRHYIDRIVDAIAPAPGQLMVEIGPGRGALTIDLGAIGDRLRIVGNLPYHVSSPLLFHCAQFESAIADMHFMLQAEVVDRMAARPDTPEYGRLSVTLQSLFAVDKLFRVPAGAFHPVPLVDSAVVRLRPLIDRPKLLDRSAFEAVVAAAFGQRRKTLRNALSRLIDAERIAALGIDPGTRGETLAVGQFAAIANAVAGERAPSLSPLAVGP
jgi:16S rRNA (adenine1518-N6/adenine1519-N6)-dimethyltransferase